MHDIFICYKVDDIEIVDPIINKLESLELVVFHDQQTEHGVVWEPYILNELIESRCMLVMVSNAKEKSEFMDIEIDCFIKQRIIEKEYKNHRIIPFIIEPNLARNSAVFFGISSYQSTDFFKSIKDTQKYIELFKHDKKKYANEFIKLINSDEKTWGKLIKSINKNIERAKYFEIKPNPLDLQQLEQELTKANEDKESIENQMAELKLQPENKDILSVKRSISRAQAIYERGINEQLDISLTNKSKKYLDELIQIHNNLEKTNLKTIQQQTRLNAAYEEIKDKIANIEAKINAHNP